MKSQSCIIKLKLGQLNYLAKLCIYIKLEHCTFKAGQFAYQPNCPIPFLSKINIEFWDTLFNGPQACDVRILPSKNKIHDGKSFLKLFNLQQVENFEHFHYRIFSERNDSIQLKHLGTTFSLKKDLQQTKSTMNIEYLR